MQLEEAIRTMQEDFTNQHPYTPARVSEAKQLGIEALKHMKSERTIYGFKRHIQMPGETK